MFERPFGKAITLSLTDLGDPRLTAPHRARIADAIKTARKQLRPRHHSAAWVTDENAWPSVVTVIEGAHVSLLGDGTSSNINEMKVLDRSETKTWSERWVLEDADTAVALALATIFSCRTKDLPLTRKIFAMLLRRNSCIIVRGHKARSAVCVMEESSAGHDRLEELTAIQRDFPGIFNVA